MLLCYVLLLIAGCCSVLQPVNGCSSPTFDFTNYVNSQELDLTTAPGTAIISFPVQDVQSVSVFSQPVYIEAKLVEGNLMFSTTQIFSQYEEREVQQFILVQLTYQCAGGPKTGLFRQYLKLANNHEPKFLQQAYEARVPLPLPKHFDVSPYIAEGAGIAARDIDLLNNRVQFSVSPNDYFTIESLPVKGDTKQFRAILRLKEQLLKLADTVELNVTATDEGEPPKSSQVTVTIEPDLFIVYDDPPEFKETFVNGTVDKDAVIQLELIPGTQTADIEYALEGSDAEHFSLSVWANSSGLDLRVINLDALPKRKPFLNVVVVGRRTALQRTSAVILLSIPSESEPEVPEPPTETTIERVLVVLQLEEMTEHRDVFPLVVGENCVYSIDFQTPGDYFFVEQEGSSTLLSSRQFDREDETLFDDLDFPQFWVVLQLHCQTQLLDAISNVPQSYPHGPIRNISYSTKQTHLNIIVQDINDNSPEFTYPSNNAMLVFPSGVLAQKLLPEYLVKVEAIDRDEGLNAVVRYRLAPNNHFDIEPSTGVIFPLKSALAEEHTSTLEVYATDRDGAQDGNTSTMKMKVFRGSEEQFFALRVDNMDPRGVQKLLIEIGKSENVQLGTVTCVYTVASVENNKSSSGIPTERYATQAIVYGLNEGTLLSYEEMVGLFKPLQSSFSLTYTKIGNLYTSPTNLQEPETTLIYPYIIVAAFFGALAVGMAAAAFYFRAKALDAAKDGPNFPSDRPSINSSATIVAHAQSDPASTPPSESNFASTPPPENNFVQQLAGATPTETDDFSETTNTSGLQYRTNLLAIEEEAIVPSKMTSEVQSGKSEKKNITFNERVERIEVFEKYPDNSEMN